MREQTQTLSQLTKKSIGNPADLLPKKKRELRDGKSDALGDLAYVIQKENEETEKIAKAMIEDMQRARAKGLTPQFRTDPLATEGMQPIQITVDMKNTEGIDSNIPTDGPIKIRPSECMDPNAITSITNYIKPPTYVNRAVSEFNDTPVIPIDVENSGGPRSLMVDEHEIDVNVYNKQLQENKSQQEVVKNSEDGVDPDDDSDIMLLLQQEFEE